MPESKKLLELLTSTVPANTPVTISAEIIILESLGIVAYEKALTAMRTAALLVPPDTPAKFKGLVNMLTQLKRMNPKFSEKHMGVLTDALAEAGQIDDFQLTFGAFLPICQKIMEVQQKRPSRS